MSYTVIFHTQLGNNYSHVTNSVTTRRIFSKGYKLQKRNLNLSKVNSKHVKMMPYYILSNVSRGFGTPREALWIL